MTSVSKDRSDLVYDVLKEFYVLWHNKLKEIVVKEKKLMSERTFEKALVDLVDSKRVFKIREKKVKQHIYGMEKGKKRYIKSKGTPLVYYTTQKRIVRLKPNFTKFCKTQLESLNNQHAEFEKTIGKNISEKEIITKINNFSMSLFVLDNIINSVNNLLHYWQDFRWELNQWIVQIDIRRTSFWVLIQEHYKNIYEKIMTETQLNFMKSNEIYPYNLIPKKE